ncbi:hypothetical protein SASPL_128721 [Salvia splendens]|uniref:Exostosin GT47 domain-containing protein n=1 Tax=Salvia splendens TaxID=180675 RepID=A0A8X8XFT2_SALSN|nr:hypothetical protein SASPL_128721 [Salvia splendens]
MRNLRWALIMCFFLGSSLRAETFKLKRSQKTERISGSAGDVLEDDPVGRLKVFVYKLPSKYKKKMVEKEERCLHHMFAAEIYMHRFLLSSPVRTLNPQEADWFYIPEDIAVERGILPLLERATLVQTFGQRNHVCQREGSITIPPYAPPQKMQTHVIPPTTPRAIFVYFRGLFYDAGNDPQGGYYARGARASVWENFKNNPLFDISTEHTPTYYEDMQRAIFCLSPLGWAPLEPPPRGGRGLRETTAARQSTHETGHVVPAACSAGRCFPSDLEWTCSKAAPPHRDDAFLKPGEPFLNWTTGPFADLKPW